jgi:hypothetical protein
MPDLHAAVQHLLRAAQMVRALGARHRQRALDEAVVQIGQAIYGRNVVSVRAARQHVRAALTLVRRVRVPGATAAAAQLRAALRAMGR